MCENHLQENIDYIIHPFTGKHVKSLNILNLKQYGFNNLEEFKEQYPNQAICCQNLLNIRSVAGKKSNLNFIENSKKSKEIYYENPKLCLQCNEPILYEKRNENKFCNHTHAAIYTNSLRGPETYKPKLPKKRKLKPEEKLQIKIKKYKKNPKLCMKCNKPISYERKKRKTCDENCFKIIKSEITRKGGFIGGKVSAAKQIKRSKEEIELYNLCKNHFNNVTHNEPLVDGWDADIIIHDNKTAILWNGPWHYKNMPGLTHSLLQVQTRDKIKIDVLTKHGWNVLVFEDRSYTPKDAFQKLVK